MVKHCSDSQRKMYDTMRQQVVNFFCPDLSVEIVDSVLAQIRVKASNISVIRSFAPKKVGFKCKCGHTEAYSTHTQHMQKVRPREAQDSSGQSLQGHQRAGRSQHGGHHTHPMMSHGYNFATVPKQNVPNPKKRATDSTMKKMVRGNRVHMDTKDKHILSAKVKFERSAPDWGSKACAGAPSNCSGAMSIVSRSWRIRKWSWQRACSTFQKPSGKVWTKKFSKGTFNTSKKKRLKMMTFKKV